MIKSFAMGFSDFNKYQKRCKQTAVYPKIGKNFVYPVLGLVGEAGEVSEKIKKLFRDRGGVLTKEYKLEIAKELGDVLWYIAQLSTELGLKFSDVVEMNLEKLASRKTRSTLHGDGDNR
jgi:NTP pyrophosphatase (non-canonical NTP hydrolase)